MKNNCYVIAEAGLNHNGSVDNAKKLIDVASVAGADAVKFQKRTISKLAVKQTMDAEDLRFPEFGKTYKEIREHLEFNESQYLILKEYSESKGLDFIVTAFDIDAVDFLLKIGVTIIKLASHSLTNLDLIKYLESKKITTILSSGMSELAELDAAINVYENNKDLLSVLHCVSSYPTPYEASNINMIQVLKERYKLRVGYSGHEIGYLPTLIAVTMGATIVERHITLDKNMIGFDHKISLEPNELWAMIRDIRSVDVIKGDGTKKVSEQEMITRNKYHVSMTSSRNIIAGEVLELEMIEYKNPGTGIPYKNANLILGKKAKTNINKDTLLSKEMFED